MKVAHVTLEVELALLRLTIKLGRVLTKALRQVGDLSLVHGAHLVILIANQAHVDVVRGRLLTEPSREFLRVHLILVLGALHRLVGLAAHPPDRVAHCQVVLTDDLIRFLARALLKLEHVLQLEMVADHGLIVPLLLVQCVQRLIVLLVEAHILVAQLLLESGLIFLHALHEALIVLFLFGYEVSHLIDLLSALIDLIVRHINGAKNVGLALRLEGQA